MGIGMSDCWLGGGENEAIKLEGKDS